MGRLHDTILLYTRSDSYLWNQVFTEYSEDYKKSFYKHIEPDTGRRYQLGDLTAPGGANKGNLVEYLQGFEHTTAVMQTKEALEQIAYEMMEDMKNDGVCYVETRFAPVFHTNKGLYPEDIVSAVLDGLEKGKKDFGVGYGLILCGMRNMM